MHINTAACHGYPDITSRFINSHSRFVRYFGEFHKNDVYSCVKSNIFKANSYILLFLNKWKQCSCI